MKYTGSTLFKKRIGWGRWRWVHIRTCPKCKKEHHVLGNDSRLKPDLPPGAIICEIDGCNGKVPLG